jgi:hypothetical protein
VGICESLSSEWGLIALPPMAAGTRVKGEQAGEGEGPRGRRGGRHGAARAVPNLGGEKSHAVKFGL